MDAADHDDAAVYRLSEDRALVATVDFFTPIVDDARTWGAIAAANALSDIYAMGGTPLFALNLVGWPRDALPFALLGEVIAGAAEVASRAGCLMVGGPSVDDAEPKFGMAAIGEVHPDRMLTNRGARPGDVLVLTKPLGTGVLTTALKRDLLDPADLAAAVESMTALNDTAARVALAHGARAATDVTGFGLLGHLGNILAGSAVGAELAFDALPVLPGVMELVKQGVVPGGTRRNLAAATSVRWDAGLTEAEQILCADAQTSGGLLMAFPPEQVTPALAALGEAGTIAKAVIGRCTAEVGIVRVRRTV